MGIGIFLGVVGFLTAIFVGVKCAVHYSDRKAEREEKKRQKEELRKDSEKYLLEDDLFNPEVKLPYKDNEKRDYESKNQYNTNFDLDR